MVVMFFLAFELPSTRGEKLLVGKLLGAFLGSQKTKAKPPVTSNKTKGDQKNDVPKEKEEEIIVENKEVAKEGKICENPDSIKVVLNKRNDMSPSPYEKTD